MRMSLDLWWTVLSSLPLVAGLAVLFPGQAGAGEGKPAPPAGTFGIDKASQPEPGLIAAGQPTPEQLKEAAQAGYKTVLDLRPPAEARGFDEAQVARDAGLEYVNIPVTADTLDAATLGRFFAEFDKAERPVLVHCASSNRVGALYYAYLVQEKGMAKEEALAKARKAGLTSAELEAKIVSLVDQQPKQ